MLIYFFLPLMVSFSRNWQLKTSTVEENVTFLDIGTDRRNIFFQILTYIDMIHVNFLFQRLLVSATQTDRQTRQIFNDDLLDVLSVCLFVSH